jgi:hypothetical protein
MNNLATKSGEFVALEDMLKTDIFLKLMESDNVRQSDFLKLCQKAKQEIVEYRNVSAA